jgi:WD40 repeat protein
MPLTFENFLLSVAFSDDGKHVVGASNDFALRIWSLSTSRVLYALNGHQVINTLATH